MGPSMLSSNPLTLRPTLPFQSSVLSAVASVVSDSCKPTDYSRPGSSVHGTFQARVLKWVAIPFCIQSSRLANSFP